ncbi:MAG: ATP-binding protein [Bacteroidetes bacterium]|nr:ATP-binding protein [Bacteroidota bacterium]
MRSEEYILTISSSAGSIHQVERFIEDICDRFNLTNNYFGNISMAIMEAVDNAIKHGNKNCWDKKVSIRLDLEPGLLKFSVKDEGEGFNYYHIPDPTDPFSSSSEKVGRGIFIIRSMADEIHYNAPGNELTMIFYVSGISEKTFKERENKIKSYTAKAKKKITKR